MATIMNGFIFTIFLSLFLKATAYTVSFPAVTGPYDVGTIALELTDYSRTNPFKANMSCPGPRSIMVSLYYPAGDIMKYPLAPYMPPQTAAFYEELLSVPNGTFSTVIQPNSHSGAPMEACDEAQAILFSPGLGISRFGYTTFAEDLASHGYIVVTMDHPYDADIVEFPDGSIISPEPSDGNLTTEKILHFEGIRVKDAQFTLDMLETNLTKSIPGVHKQLRIKATGMFGHSLGGATTSETMLVDDRILGGLNMDGAEFGTAQEKGLDNPFVLMGASTHNLTSDPTWTKFWGNLRGWKRTILLAGSEHLTYSDLPVIAELLGLRDSATAADIETIIGTINGLRANEIQTAYISDFFDFVLRGGKAKLYNGPDPRYPEISFQS